MLCGQWLAKEGESKNRYDATHLSHLLAIFKKSFFLQFWIQPKGFSFGKRHKFPLCLRQFNAICEMFVVFFCDFIPHLHSIKSLQLKWSKIQMLKIGQLWLPERWTFSGCFCCCCMSELLDWTGHVSFLAVQNSSIGDLFTHSLSQDFTNEPS